MGGYTCRLKRVGEVFIHKLDGGIHGCSLSATFHNFHTCYMLFLVCFSKHYITKSNKNSS